jgi:hypothetical protein
MNVCQNHVLKGVINYSLATRAPKWVGQALVSERERHTRQAETKSR